MNKNKLIKQTLQATKLRRSFKSLRVFSCKVQTNKLSSQVHKNLLNLFVESKNFYNFLLSDYENNSKDSKLKEVSILTNT